MRVIVAVLLAFAMVDCKEFTINGTKINIPLPRKPKNSYPFITGGDPASARKQPYLVGILVHIPNRRLSICGASMLSNTRSVTAAHCWRGVDYQAEYFTLAFGADNIYTDGTRVNTTDVEIHAHYNMKNSNNDIAMIRHKHIEYNDTIKPIALPSGDFLNDNNDFVDWTSAAVGFGATSDDIRGIQNEMRYIVLIDVISNEECGKKFNRPSAIIESTLCADTTGGRSTCIGDSGGPLVTGDNDQLFLIGITSFGLYQYCESGDPAAFTRVTSFVPWIRERL